MNDLCQQMQDKMPGYILGALDGQEAEILNKHTAECLICRQYLEALKRQNSSLIHWAAQVQADMPPREAKVIEALNHLAPAEPRPLRKVVANSSLTKLAAAALFILAVGFLAGRLSAPQLDLNRLRTSLETSMRAAIQEDLKNMDSRWQSALAVNGELIKNEIGSQVQRHLAESASQMLAASVTLTNQRLEKLVQLIEAARLQDRRRVEGALEQIEWNRLQDKVQIGSGLQALAVKTGELPDIKESQPN